MLLRHLLGREDEAGLVPAGMLVPAAFDELQVPIHQSQQGRFSRAVAQVIVLTTRRCNLTCSYCYQKPILCDSAPMTPEAAAGAARYVEWLIRDNRCRAASVGFYGGEPLLNVDACVRIMEALAAFAAAEGIEVEFPVTTNGSLLTRVRGSALFDHVSAFHLTIEGDRGTHDAIRRTAAGRGSYDQILAGIALVVERGLRLIIRLHQNELTAESFTRVLDDLAAAGLRPDSKAAIYSTSVAPRSPFASAGQCRRELTATRAQALAQERELAALGRRHRLAPLLSWEIARPTAPPEQRAIGCAFASCASCAVDSNGDLYKCPDDLRPEARIGTIGEDGRPRWTSRYYQILGSRWWHGGACRQCEYLPVCGSGCTLQETPRSLDDCARLRRWYHSVIEQYVDHYLRTRENRGTVPIQHAAEG